MFRSGETLGLFTGNKGGHNKHFLKFSAFYYFLPFQNLKFLDYPSLPVCNNAAKKPYLLTFKSSIYTSFFHWCQCLLLPCNNNSNRHHLHTCKINRYLLFTVCRSALYHYVAAQSTRCTDPILVKWSSRCSSIDPKLGQCIELP